MPAALVVERDVVLRNVVRSVLIAQGFEMLDAATAAEAVTLCESFGEPRLDLLIVDHTVRGPGDTRNSGTVVEQILRLSPGIKVLVISDCPYQVVYRENGLAEGAWFLQKPFTAAQFVDMVKNITQPRIQ